MSNNARGACTICVVFAFLACSGCWNTLYVASANGYVTTKTGEGTPFRVQVINSFGLWGSVPGLKVVEVDRVVSQVLRRDIRHITGLKITEGSGPEFFLTFITLGLYSPRALVIEGEYTESPPNAERDGTATPALIPRSAPAPPSRSARTASPAAPGAGPSTSNAARR